MKQTKTTRESFWNNLDKTSLAPCWFHQLNPKSWGFSKITFDGRQWSAHRLAWTLLNGEIPVGDFIIQNCGNKGCCNPDHLILNGYRLRRRRNKPEDFWAIVRRGDPSECWEAVKSINSKSGYSYFRFNGKIMPGHRFAWEQTFGPIPKGLFACHKCDNRKCCNPNHIFLGTAKDNRDDCIRKGRANVARGEGKIKLHKLTDGGVREIRKRFPSIEALYGNTRRIAEEFGVSTSAIRDVVNGRRWAHIA